MASYPFILAPDAADRVRAGAKTQVRLIASSPLRDCRPGDRLWVKETCVGGRRAPGQSHDLFAAIYKADFVVFTDGWRQDKQGHGQQGCVPTSRKLEWAPAIRMPRWASRTELVVESVTVEPLRGIDRAGVVADGQGRGPRGGDMGLGGKVEGEDVAYMIPVPASPAGRSFHGACINIDAGITAE